MIDFILEHKFMLLFIVFCCLLYFPWGIQIYHKNKAKGVLQGFVEFTHQIIKEEEEKSNGKDKKK